MKKTNFRWIICLLLFAATTVNYMDRQVLSLTWKDFIAPDFHWTDSDYGHVAAVFSIVYAIANLFSGRFIDWLGTKKGYLCAIFVWSLGACLHALCGVATTWSFAIEGIRDLVDTTGMVAATVAMVSSFYFIVARVVLAIGESGNFPAAIKVVAEYFPKRDRAFATACVNSGTAIGALAAPLSVPLLARYFRDMGIGHGWEMAFILIGLLGFIWMGFWVFVYQHPEQSKHVNKAELDYINMDAAEEQVTVQTAPQSAFNGASKHHSHVDRHSHHSHTENAEKKVSLWKMLSFPQTWAIFLAKLVTDGVWWFFLFWTPAYLSDVYGLPSDNPMAMLLLFTLYFITMASIPLGKLPTIIINRTGLNAYEARLWAMLCYAFVPLLTLFAQHLGDYSYWFPIIIIGCGAAAHQAWSANLYSVGSDLFPKSVVGTMTGINGMAGGIGSFIINKLSGELFDFAAATEMQFMGLHGKPAGYMMIFCYCAVAYLLGWIILKCMVPRYKPVKL